MAVAGVIMIQGNNAYDDELSDVDDKSKNKYNNDDNYNDISEGHPKPIFPRNWFSKVKQQMPSSRALKYIERPKD